ncbi:hypothetical protein HY091_02545 [Candidatus Kaiserbacteria bacterium]|nr:hypothetical protein [Candidatus Kaiserbacteria bacterium]
MVSIFNLDLLWVGLAVAGAGTLGFSIYFSDPKNPTSRAFLFFAFLSIFWSIANFASARATDPTTVLWFIRAVLFFATWHAFSFFVLAHQFLERQPVFTTRVFAGFLSWTAAVSIVVLTPVVYEAVTAVSPSVETRTGPGITLFALTVFGFVGIAIWTLTRKFLRSSGAERRQMEFVLAGVLTTFFFLVVFDFIFPAFFNNPTLVPYGGLFLLPLIFGTAYAILAHRLFDVRVAIFGLLTFLLATATFFDILLSDSVGLVLYRTGELALVLVAGIWLIKSMVREFELEQELSETNTRQEGLLRFISHEVKGFLTKDAAAFAALAEGDFGALPQQPQEFIVNALAQTRGGVSSVMDILKASNQKKGTTEYKKEPFDLAVLAKEAVENAQPAAKSKGLALTFTADPADAQYTVIGDKAEIGEHVLRNLVENALTYTPTGRIDVSLTKGGNGRFIFTVADTGIGISNEDKSRLFTEGGHGKDSQKVNVHSTGYGLFIAKNIVKAHGGIIRAESAGPSKGSRFVVELPA